MDKSKADLYTIGSGCHKLSFKNLLNLMEQIEEKLCREEVQLQFKNGSIRAWVVAKDGKTLGEVVLQQGLVFKSKLEKSGYGTVMASGIFESEQSLREGE